MADENTRRKVDFARILVEVEIKNKLKDMVYFRNEKGVVIEQELDYEWKPIQYKGGLKYGHEEDTCRFKVRIPTPAPAPEGDIGGCEQPLVESSAQPLVEQLLVKNRIIALCADDGIVVDEENDIACIFVNLFKNMLGTNASPKGLS